MIRHPISGAIVVALFAAPAFADPAAAPADLVAAVAPEEAFAAAPDAPPTLLSPEEIRADTSMVPFFHPSVSAETRHAALRAFWAAHPGINDPDRVLDPRQ